MWRKVAWGTVARPRKLQRTQPQPCLKPTPNPSQLHPTPVEMTRFAQLGCRAVRERNSTTSKSVQEIFSRLLPLGHCSCRRLKITTRRMQKPSKDPRTQGASSAEPSLGLRFLYAETPTFQRNLGVWREIRRSQRTPQAHPSADGNTRSSDILHRPCTHHPLKVLSRPWPCSQPAEIRPHQ